MKTASGLLIASLASFAFAAPAFAADEPPADGAAAEPAPDGMAPDPNAAPAMPDPNAAAASTSARWPRAVIARPLTLPAGVFMVGADIVNFLANDAIGFFDPAFVRVLVGYGITDDIELGFAHYAFPTTDVGKGDISVNLGYKLARGAMGGKLEAIARLDLGYDLAGSVDLTTGETSGALNPLGLGVQVQYNVNEKIALYTPGSQLTIGLESPNGIALDLPVGVGFQATPELFAFLQTSLLTIAIKDAGESTFIFADRTPLQLGATYNVMPALDINVALALDVSSDAIDQTLALLVGARYYGGKLN